MRIFSLSSLCRSALFTLAFVSATAAVIGTNPPSQPLTEQRIDALPHAQQAAWKQYLEKSQRQMQVDKDSLQAELKKAGTAVPPAAAHGGNARSIPLERDAAWYATAEATHIADVVLSFQTPAGGWSKNLDMSKTPRLPGQSYASGPDGTASLATPDDFGRVSDAALGLYQGRSTTTPPSRRFHFLAKVVTAPRRDHPGCCALSHKLPPRHRLSPRRAVSQRRLAADMASGWRLSRRHHVQRRRDDSSHGAAPGNRRRQR